MRRSFWAAPSAYQGPCGSLTISHITEGIRPWTYINVCVFTASVPFRHVLDTYDTNGQFSLCLLYTTVAIFYIQAFYQGGDRKPGPAFVLHFVLVENFSMPASGSSMLAFMLEQNSCHCGLGALRWEPVKSVTEMAMGTGKVFCSCTVVVTCTYAWREMEGFRTDE